MYDRVKANFPVSEYTGVCGQASKLPRHLLCRPLLDTLLNTTMAHGAVCLTLMGRLILLSHFASSKAYNHRLTDRRRKTDMENEKG